MTIKTLIISTALIASATLANAADHTVTITDFSFQPAILTIAAGDTVTFVNKDGAPHTATQKGGFDTDRLKKNQDASLAFSKAGTFDYFCKFHRKMTGQIIVK